MQEEFLIQGLKSRDKVVFDFVFSYYYSGLCVYAMKYIQDSDAVEDIVQEFFVRLWVNKKDPDIKTSLKAYFFTSIKNRCLDYLKHQKVKDEYAKDLHKGSEVEGSVVENYYVESELNEVIQLGLEKLPQRCKEIFVMSRFEGKTNQEIADQLNISKRTVELQISNGLKKLRVELKDYLPAFIIAMFIV